MPRQSISLTEPNAQWVKSQIESKEYTSVSDALNDLIRQARRDESRKMEVDNVDKIRAMLIEAEQSIQEHGYSQRSTEDRLHAFKEQAQKDGKL